MAKDKTQILLENSSVYEETLNEFSLKPYELASVNEIIKRSQYNKGSFYYRFKDKFELYISLLDYVFVIQIDLLKKSGFSLIEHSDLRPILSAMYHNLYALYQEDERYFNLIEHLFNEKQSFIDHSLEASVGSLYQRFSKKIHAFTNLSKERRYMIDILYRNFPVEMIDNESTSINQLLDTIFDSDNLNDIKLSDHGLKIDFMKVFKEPVNYLLMSQYNKDTINNGFHLIQASQNIKGFKRILRCKSLMFSFNLKKMMKKHQSKAIFNHLGIDSLLNNAYDEIKDDNILFPVLTTLFYAILDLKPLIIISDLIEKLNPHQKELFFDYILQINGHLSKIVLIEDSLYLNHHFSFDIFYYLDEFMSLKTYKISLLKDSYLHTYYCEYSLEDQYHQKYFKSLDEFINFRKNNQIKVIGLEMIYSLSIDKIREGVSL